MKSWARRITTVLFVLTRLNAAEQQAAPPQLQSVVKKLVADTYPKLDALYKHFHAHPELSLHEEKTSAKLAAELREAGFQVTHPVGGHGLVAVLRNGPGPTLLIRSDLDALPVTEQTGLSYASVVQTKDDKGNTVGVMHACGHDVHMTVLAGTARVMNALKDQWRGTLVLIGQPAEERVQGARAMLADGLFKRFPKPDMAIALHCAADLPAGMVGVNGGNVLANVDSVDVVIRGVGGHGAWPHRTKDPVVLAAETVLALQTIVSRETDPLEPAVVTIGSIHGGTKYNIIPDEVRLQLTLRSYSDEVRKHSIEAIKRITRGLAQAAGLPEDRYPEVTVADESASATYNDPALSQKLEQTFHRWIGEKLTARPKPTMGAEDFGLFGRTEEKIPICMFWLGTVSKERFAEHERDETLLPPLHSSRFQPDPRPTIQTGVTAMSAAALELLGAPSQR
ncbi:MAG TPA: amidohydrolase [Verrucomicrobiae bacterium]|jgi:hippurate hydrolase